MDTVQIVAEVWTDQINLIGSDVARSILERIEQGESADSIIADLTADLGGQEFNLRQTIEDVVLAISLVASCITIHDNIAVQKPQPPQPAPIQASVMSELNNDKTTNSILRRLESSSPENTKKIEEAIGMCSAGYVTRPNS